MISIVNMILLFCGSLGVFLLGISYYGMFASKRKYAPRSQKSELRTDGKFDVVIIGGGLSGLVPAAYLAKLNWKVLVLDANERIGGALRGLTAPIAELNDRSYHGFAYCGSPMDTIQPILDQIGSETIKWQRIGSEDNLYTWGKSQHVKDIITGEALVNHAQFIALPRNVRDFAKKNVGADQRRMTKYVNFVFETTSAYRLWLKFRLLKPKWLRRAMDWCYLSPLIQRYCLRAGQTDFSDHTQITPWAKSNWIHHADFMEHMWRDGGFYPAGGASAIILSLQRTILSHGGQIRTNTKVTDLIHHPTDNCITGVMVQDLMDPAVFKEVQADYFIAACGLDGLEAVTGLPNRRSEKSIVSTATVILNQKVTLSPETIWLSDGTFIFSPSCKDPNWVDEFQVVNICKITPVEYDNKEQHIGTSLDHDQKHCQHLTAQDKQWTPIKTIRILKSAIGDFPDAWITRVVYKRFHFGSNLPQSYSGSFDTSVKNLFLSTTELTVPTIEGAFHSGMMCANAITGYGSFWDFWIGRSLQRDLESQR